jgi:hypothetical protein
LRRLSEPLIFAEYADAAEKASIATIAIAGDAQKEVGQSTKEFSAVTIVSVRQRFRRCCVILKLLEPLTFTECADAAEKHGLQA